MVRAAAKCQPPVSAAVRQLCAARLLAGIDSVAKRAAAVQRPQQAAAGQAGAAAGAAADGAADEGAAQQRREEAAALAEVATYVAGLQETPVRGLCNCPFPAPCSLISKCQMCLHCATGLSNLFSIANIKACST